MPGDDAELPRTPPMGTTPVGPGAGWEAEPSPAHPTFGLDHDDRLPWLESADRYADEAGIDNRRVAGVVLAGLALLGGAVGGTWWATHRHAGAAPVADGSLIAAPSEAAKEAPAEPGGKTYAGTGDASFAMSQGKSRPAQLAADAAKSAGKAAGSASAMASAAALAAASAGADAVNAGRSAKSADAAVHAPKIVPVAAAPMVVAGGAVVQVGAYSTAAAAEAGWAKLIAQYAMLAPLKHRAVEGQADIGTVFRLQAIPAGDSAGALCEKLRAAGGACQVKR